MAPLRLGTTSYILLADILPNVRYLADRVQDVELVLFEVDDGVNNLLGREVVYELAALANDHHLSYTVHFPLDLHLGAGGEALDRSLEKAKAVAERTRPLDPWAYVLHLSRTRVVHLHGVGDRDHQSLDLGSPDALQRVLDVLRSEPFDGVLTVEVFGQEDFESSVAALEGLGVPWPA